MLRASCAKGQDRGGVYTSSDPPPPHTQMFLDFLIGIWSGADVEIATIATTAASAAPAAAGVGPLNGACCGALLLGRCRGRVRLSLPLRCDSFCRRSVQCMPRRMNLVLTGSKDMDACRFLSDCACTGDGTLCAGVRPGCGSCRDVVCRSPRMPLGYGIINIGQYSIVEPLGGAKGRTERSL